MSIGLKKGAVALEPHSPEWETAAQEMILTLKSILKNSIVDAQHIGSTAIKSICAKPIIDIAVGTVCFDHILSQNDALAKAGIIYRGEDHPGQLLYVCSDPERGIQTHFIHVVIHGQDAWNHYLDMRDYLNCHEDQARAYAALKEQLAGKYPMNRAAYTLGKSELIEDILHRTAAWRMQQAAAETP